MQLVKHSFLSSLILITILISSCKKNHDVISYDPAVTPPISISPAQLNDSALIYARDLYLWYNQIPSTFDAKTFADPNKVMEAIRAYSIEPGYTAPVDKWSFAMKKTEWDSLSSGLSLVGVNTASGGDFGITVFFKSEGDLRVRQVEKQSPAGIAGITRSWRILKLNGNSNITTSNSQFIIDNVYNSTATIFTLQKPDGNIIDINLNAAHYSSNPVYMDSVYNISNKKIGYMVFTSFLGDMNQINTDFQRVFNRFANQNATDIIIDLRYNGGGYVSVQETLANYLVGSPATGSLMMKEQYNDKNSGNNATTYFQKKGSLNAQHIYFIVSKSTASASELLINNLKPYMDVKLIGPNSTHGKPVGFFPVPVGDWYVFPVSFKTTNKNGEGNYYNGLPLNSQVADGLDKNWGDINESCLANALKYITTGSFMVTRDTNVEPDVNESNSMLDDLTFKGSIETRKNLK